LRAPILIWFLDFICHNYFQLVSLALRRATP
jgi:hypothetical protein